MSTMRSSICAPDHKMCVNLRLAVFQRDITNEGKQLDLFVQLDRGLILFDFPVNQPSSTRLRAPIALKLLPASFSAPAKLLSDERISSPVSRMTMNVFGLSATCFERISRPPLSYAQKPKRVHR
jgi:hypothetical protein